MTIPKKTTKTCKDFIRQKMWMSYTLNSTLKVNITHLEWHEAHIYSRGLRMSLLSIWYSHNILVDGHLSSVTTSFKQSNVKNEQASTNKASVWKQCTNCLKWTATNPKRNVNVAQTHYTFGTSNSETKILNGLFFKHKTKTNL